MAFVKLDCGILNSTLWMDSDARMIFITALLMAEPFEAREPMAQIEVRSLKKTGFIVPPNWYGFVAAAGVGIVFRAGMEQELGLSALERLGAPEVESRSPEFDGRRLVRVAGGFILLNYERYRQKDHTAATRQARYRQKLKEKRYGVTSSHNAVTGRNVTQAEAEAEAEADKDKKTARKRAPVLDSEWIAELRESAAYKHLDLDAEVEKARLWLITNAPSRQFTRKYVLGWLNRQDKPLGAIPSQPAFKPLPGPAEYEPKEANG